MSSIPCKPLSAVQVPLEIGLGGVGTGRNGQDRTDWSEEEEGLQLSLLVLIEPGHPNRRCASANRDAASAIMSETSPVAVHSSSNEIKP